MGECPCREGRGHRALPRRPSSPCRPLGQKSWPSGFPRLLHHCLPLPAGGLDVVVDEGKGQIGLLRGRYVVPYKLLVMNGFTTFVFS